MKQTRFGVKKTLLTACAVLALLAVILTATGAFASLGDSTSVVTVKPGTVGCAVSRDYAVQNTGTIPALLRARIVVNWVDEAGNLLAEAPEGAVLKLEAPQGWTQLPADAKEPWEGEWYCNQIVEPGASCPFLGKLEAEGGQVRVTVLKHFRLFPPPLRQRPGASAFPTEAGRAFPVEHHKTDSAGFFACAVGLFSSPSGGPERRPPRPAGGSQSRRANGPAPDLPPAECLPAVLRRREWGRQRR